MISLLNEGPGFVPVKKSLNITQAIVDLEKYERRMKWHEYYSDDQENSKKSQTQNDDLHTNTNTNVIDVGVDSVATAVVAFEETPFVASPAFALAVASSVLVEFVVVGA